MKFTPLRSVLEVLSGDTKFDMIGLAPSPSPRIRVEYSLFDNIIGSEIYTDLVSASIVIIMYSSTRVATLQ